MDFLCSYPHQRYQTVPYQVPCLTNCCRKHWRQPKSAIPLTEDGFVHSSCYLKDLSSLCFLVSGSSLESVHVNGCETDWVNGGNADLWTYLPWNWLTANKRRLKDENLYKLSGIVPVNLSWLKSIFIV